MNASGSKPPFKKGTIVENGHGERFRVTREYVPEARPDYADLECFELVEVGPRRRFQQAAAMAGHYTEVPDV